MDAKLEVATDILFVALLPVSAYVGTHQSFSHPHAFSLLVFLLGGILAPLAMQGWLPWRVFVLFALNLALANYTGAVAAAILAVVGPLMS